MNCLCLLSIKMRSWDGCNEELRSICTLKSNKLIIKTLTKFEDLNFHTGPALAIDNKKGFSCLNVKLEVIENSTDYHTY